MYDAFLNIYADHCASFWTAVVAICGLAGLVVVLWWNILCRRRVEASLRHSEASNRDLNRQFQTLLDGIPDHLMLVGSDYNLRWMNRAARDYAGSTAQMPLPFPCYQQWRRAETPCPDCPVKVCFATGRPQELEMPAGERIFRVKAFPVRNEQDEVEHVIKLATEITAEIGLRQEAERHSRLAALGELSAGIAHEINNPTGLILANIACITEVCGDIFSLLDEHHQRAGDFPLGGLSYVRMREELPMMVDEMADGARRIRQIVTDLKDFARGGTEAQPLVECDLNVMTRRALRLVESRIRQTTEIFQLRLHPGLLLVHGNSFRLEQVLVNLLANACQALPARDRGLFVTTEFDRVRKECRFVVRDEGVGIAPEHLARIVDPFFTTRREQGGTGLGLSISHRIVAEHGGSLNFVSPPACGTTVILTLPASEQTVC